jgi:rhodanese-related sulfurtransferase
MTLDDLLIEARGVLPHRPGAGRGPRRAGRRATCWSTFVATISPGPAGWSLGRLCCPRNSLEWRCDPASQWRHPEINNWARPLILICNQGFQSTLAAATLHRLGLVNATEAGGLVAWAAASLPQGPGPGHASALGHHQDGSLSDSDNAR